MKKSQKLITVFVTSYALLATLVPFVSAADSRSKLEFYYNLHRPEGEGPFPAVMLVPGCGGLETERVGRGKELREQGYVAIFVDYLSARGVNSACKGAVPRGEIIKDIHSSISYLKAQPFVDPSRISVLGWSLGGGSILSMLAASPEEEPPVRAAVVFYPVCRGMRPWKLMNPILMLLGGKDPLTPTCQKLAKELLEGSSIEVHTYLNADHFFDGMSSSLRSRRNYDSEAATQAWEEVRKFLNTHLKGK